MNVVSTSISNLWHPSVHHSLLLLRVMRQKHTLELVPTELSSSSNASTQGLLCRNGQALRIALATTQEEKVKYHRVYQPDHVLHFSSERIPFNELPEYLGAVTVVNHLFSSVDSLLVTMSGQDMELIRRSHATLLQEIEKLENTLESNEENSTSSMRASLSTAALFPMLKFLVEQGGLLTSAFPNISNTYTQWGSSCQEIQQHLRFVERTISDHTEGRKEASSFSTTHPFHGFLGMVHQKLAMYSSDAEENMTKDVVGDHGALKSRIHRGHAAVQAVPAGMPWTHKVTPLRKMGS